MVHQDLSDGSALAAKLERAIGYSFRNAALLRQALTHRSASRDHNERLEFLGDAVFGLVAAEMLFDAFPDMREGHDSWPGFDGATRVSGEYCA